MVAFSTLRILRGLEGSPDSYDLWLSWPNRRQNPSTIKISHSDGSFSPQLASLPLESKEYFCLVRRFVLARSSVLRILAAFSAQERTIFSVSRFRSKTVPAVLLLPCRWLWMRPGYPAWSLVCPSKRGAGCLMETTAVIPFRISAPVKLGSLSFSTPISRA